ncbi:hypothetical protein [Streptomyces sp. RFCAC02]|uniref:hypothetical protein n=1 Tax=Streptomyces sp. RFCAC02 TaxID=2499143 RepID=UPI001020D9CF|nr:hypothetical protein [Streptomyces sp. RFCAC02]
MSPSARTPEPAPDAEPRPDSIRFYGTTWVDHSGGYRVRRVLLALGSTVLTLVGAVVLWLCYVSLVGTDTASWLRSLVVLALVLCTAISFTRAWAGYTRPRPADAADESAFRSIRIVGFVGVLLAYALRSLVEAPGEKLLRLDHEAALDQYRRRTRKRSRNPSRRGKR